MRKLKSNPVQMVYGYRLWLVFVNLFINGKIFYINIEIIKDTLIDIKYIYNILFNIKDMVRYL